MLVVLADAVFATCVAPNSERVSVVPPPVALHGRFLCSNPPTAQSGYASVHELSWELDVCLSNTEPVRL